MINERVRSDHGVGSKRFINDQRAFQKRKENNKEKERERRVLTCEGNVKRMKGKGWKMKGYYERDPRKEQ